MRHPRLNPGTLIAVAHGSRDPRAAATVHELLSVVRAGWPGLDVRAAFLDHCAPSLPQVLGSVDTCVVVPLLLTDAYHSKSDIPAQLASVQASLPRPDVRLSGTLGPHPLLLAALERRLRETGDFTRAETSVVLTAAGSSDPAANASVAALAAGAVGVSAVLGDAPEVAAVIMDRYQAAAPAELAVPLVARA